MNHERAREVLHELSRKLFILANERKIAKRREMLEDILGVGEKDLKELLGLDE